MNKVGLLLLTFFFPLTSFALDPNNVDASVLTHGLFTPPATDRSIAYLGQLFGSVGNVLHGSGGQLLSYVFVVFNLAIWVIAGAFVIYTTLTAVLNAAHEGEFMGKKMHSMVPVRVVAGIAALLPKFAGYSFIQLIVMWVVVQGVGLADNVWNSAIDYFQSGGVVYQRAALGTSQAAYPFTASQYQNTLSSMQNILNAEICMYTLQNKQQNDLTNPAVTNKVPVSQGQYPTPAVQKTTSVPNGTNGILNFGSDSDHTLCGSFSYVPDHETAVDAVVSDLLPIAYVIANQKTSIPATTCLTYPNNDPSTQVANGAVCAESTQLVQEMANYLSIMTFVKQSELMTSGGAATTSGFQNAETDGWIMAGRYYHDIVSANATGSASPLQAGSDFTIANSAGPFPPTLNTISTNLSTALGTTYTAQLQTALTTTNSDPGNTLNGGYFGQATLIAANMFAAPPTTQNCPANPDTGSVCAAQQIISQLSDYYLNQKQMSDAGSNVIDNDVFALMQTPVYAWFSTVLNPTSTNLQDPVERARSIGLLMIQGAATFWADATHDSFAILTASSVSLTAALLALAIGLGWWDAGPLGGSAGANFMAATNTVVQLSFQIIMARIFWYLPLGIALSTPIFVLGATLAVYIPLIPFMLFMFAALGWFITVLEAMVAAPLVALGITHPEGHDLLGQAQQSIMLLLGVFLKPALLITGLLCGIILTFIAANLLDAGFFPLMYWQANNSGSVSGGTQFVAIVGMLVIYTMAMMAIVDQCFSLIYVLSDKILRWIGGHPEQSAEGGMLQQVKSGFEGKVGEGAQGGGQQVSAVKSSGIGVQAAPPMEKKKATGAGAADTAGSGDKGKSSDAGENSGKPETETPNDGGKQTSGKGSVGAETSSKSRSSSIAGSQGPAPSAPSQTPAQESSTPAVQVAGESTPPPPAQPQSGSQPGAPAQAPPAKGSSDDGAPPAISS